MRASAVLESALYVTDLDAAEVFYRDVLGLEPAGKVENRHAFFRCGQSIVLLFNAQATEIPSKNPALPVPVHGATGEGHLCFRAGADELGAWVQHLSAKGIEIEADFIWPKGGRSIYVRDPSGNSIEFAEARIWGLT